MRRFVIILLLPFAVSGCAGQLGGSLVSGGLSAIGNGGSLTPLTNVCVGLIGQEAMDIAALKATLIATPIAPMTVSVPTQVMMTPSANPTAPSTVTPMVVLPPPITAPKPVQTVP